MPSLDLNTGSTFSANAVGIADQKLFNRKCTLIVGDNAGNAVDLSNLQISFDVTSPSIQTLKRLECRIYNLSDTTAKKIEKEFTRVQLSAGYKNGPFGVIFDGMITYVRRGKDNAVDSYLDIVSADSDKAYNWAAINIPLPVGNNSLNDQLQAVLNVLQPYGVAAGSIPDLDKLNNNLLPGTLPSGQAYIPGTLPRAKVLYGEARNIIRQIAAAANCHWHIQDGKLNMFPYNSWLPGGTIVLDTRSGMVRAPEQTLDGLRVTALLNPNLQTGRLIQVNTSDVQTQQWFNSNDRGPQPDFQPVPVTQPGTSSIDRYRIYSLRQSGDTRGDLWDAEMICEAIDPSNGQTPSTDTFNNRNIGDR